MAAPRSSDIAIRKWQPVITRRLFRKLIWTVANLQQSKQFIPMGHTPAESHGERHRCPERSRRAKGPVRFQIASEIDGAVARAQMGPVAGLNETLQHLSGRAGAIFVIDQIT